MVGDKVLDLQEQEDEKRKRTEEIRQFVQTVFEKMDYRSQHRGNEDEFRRSIWDGSIIDLSHQERLERFMDLFDQSIDVLFGRKNKGLISMIRRHPELMLAEYRERVAGQAEHVT